MKRLFTLLLIVVFFIFPSLAQDGLEQIIVEKYYVSDENDTSVDGDGGVLPVGSKTYRVYVDMLPGYIFQAAYGEGTHELKIATTTRFFNNEDRGDDTPSFGDNRLDDNTVMLDSWLSVGAACSSCFGVLKEEDDGENTIVNGDGVLMNADSTAGVPLTEQDGIILGQNPESVTAVGIDDIIGIFGDANDAPMPTIFSTNNGSWSSLDGSMGLDSMENKVLIGQFTTDGDFSFELNIQIRNEATIAVEKYVAKDPLDGEFTIPSLMFSDTMETVVDTMLSPTENLETIATLVKIFPNPTVDQLTIEFERDFTEKGRFEIFSVNGKRIDHGIIDPSDFKNKLSHIDVHHLTNGLYFFKLQIGEYTYTQKFTKI